MSFFTFESWVFNNTIIKTNCPLRVEMGVNNFSKDTGYLVSHTFNDIIEVEELDIKTKTTWFDKVIKCADKIIAYDAEDQYILFGNQLVKPFKEYDIVYCDKILVITCLTNH